LVLARDGGNLVLGGRRRKPLGKEGMKKRGLLRA